MLESLTNLHNFQKNPYFFFDQVMPKDNDSVKSLKMGLNDFVFCYHPDQAKYVLADNKENFPKSDLVLKKILPLSGSQGLIQLDDSQAKNVRHAAATLMHPKKAQHLSKIVAGFVEEEFENFDQFAKEKKAIDLKPFLTELVLRTAGVFILNRDLKTNAAKMNESFVELNRMAGESLRSLLPSPFSFKRARHLNIIHEELDKIIGEAIKENDNSLLTELSKKGFSRDFIRDQVKAFMFAGYDTTASSLIFAIDCLSRNLDDQEIIVQEKELSYKDAEYTQACYKESLRLYPSAYFLPRQAKEDDFIFGHKIKKGTQVILSVRHIQRCPEYFDKPKDFDPKRFLSPLAHPYSFIPFGGGARICIGAPLAIMEATVVMQKLCERYEIIAANSEPPKIEGLITAHTKSELKVYLKRRRLC